MEIVPILRLLRRHRVVLGVGLLAALFTLVSLGGVTATSTSAVAWTSIALDTPKSQLVDAAAAGGDTLVWRASLLSQLMTTQATTERLAGRLAVPADQVMVTDSDTALPLVPIALPQAAATAASSNVAPYMLTVFLKNDAVPVVSLVASAPRGAGARRLAAAAVADLESQASPPGRFTSAIATDANVLQRQPFVVEQAAPVREKLVSSTSLSTKAVGAALLVLVLCCAAGSRLPRNASRIRGDRRAVSA